MTERKKMNSLPFWIAGIAFLCFLAGAFYYAFFIRAQNWEAGLSFLRESTRQRQIALNRQFEGDLQLLRGIAISLSEMDLNDREKIHRILDAVNHSNRFIRMGFAETSGRATLFDLDGTIYRSVDLSGMDFFRRALLGEDTVSSTVRDGTAEQAINYYAVPIEQAGRIAGILCAVHREDVLGKTLDLAIFNGTGHFIVADRNGVISLPTASRVERFPLGSNILEKLLLESERGPDNLRASLSSGEPSDLDFSIDGVAQRGAIFPLDVNGWHVVSVVPKSALGAHFNRTSIGITLLILAACVVFILLMYLHLRTLAKNQEELARLAYTDPTTGYRNYVKFLLDADRMRKSRRDSLYAVWSFDILGFSRVNELYGNAAGDGVLRQVADLLASHSNTGIFCRNSADQFVGMTPYRDREELKRWSENVFTAISECRACSGSEMPLNAAIGIYCIADFDNSLTMENMVNRAVVAKKIAKNPRGSQSLFFTREMLEAIRREAHLEAIAQEALNNEDITFFLQPKVHIAGAYRVAGAEALARWNDPTFGRISPDSFIPLFERNGFVVKLDRAIFKQVCKWYAGWLRAGGEPLQISINVSRQGLMRDDFIAQYVALKEIHKIPDGALELEFTESVILDDYNYFVWTVLELQKAGFACSIDDFGSGYSSLNVLKNLPIDALKLDALFFRGSNDVNRAKTVISDFIGLARKLNIRTVAEGVDEPSQVEFLRQAGCDLVQGFIFSQPLPVADFEKLDMNIREMSAPQAP